MTKTMEAVVSVMPEPDERQVDSKASMPAIVAMVVTVTMSGQNDETAGLDSPVDERAVRCGVGLC